jgi:hypothetical protein
VTRLRVAKRRGVASAVLLLALRSSALAQQPAGPSELVKNARNPLADQASAQVQPNFNFGVGEARDLEYVFDLQPVVPVALPAGWILFTRTIVPLVNEPSSDPGHGYTFGIGDIQPTLFLSPPSSESFIWGIGPVLQFPSASATSLGSGKWEIGPTAAAILTLSSWQVGAQLNNLWSYAGDRGRPSVNQLLFQPLVNFFLPENWYLTCGPQLTADWKAPARDRWTVPLGGGVGRALTIHGQALSTQLEAYYNVERPADGPTWSVILTVQFMFPE